MFEMTGVIATAFKVMRASLTILEYVRKRRFESVKKDLQGTAILRACSAASASTLRRGRVELVSKIQTQAALELQQEGKGVIRAGFYEAYVNIVPPVIQKMMVMRDIAASASYR